MLVFSYFKIGNDQKNIILTFNKAIIPLNFDGIQSDSLVGDQVDAFGIDGA